MTKGPLLAFLLALAAAGCTANNSTVFAFPTDPDRGDLNPALRERLVPSMRIQDVIRILGNPHADFCSGTSCPVWYFSDGKYLQVSEAGSGVSISVNACETTPCNRPAPFE